MEEGDMMRAVNAVKLVAAAMLDQMADGGTFGRVVGHLLVWVVALACLWRYVVAPVTRAHAPRSEIRITARPVSCTASLTASGRRSTPEAGPLHQPKGAMDFAESSLERFGSETSTGARCSWIGAYRWFFEATPALARSLVTLFGLVRSLTARQSHEPAACGSVTQRASSDAA